MTIRFIYFDLGKVLLDFDREKGCRQMAEVAGVSTQRVSQIIYDSGLHMRFEAGQIDPQGFYDEFCEQAGARPDPAALAAAANDIFTLNTRTAALVAQLRLAGYRLGILSNTQATHWEYVTDSRYKLINVLFERYALSFEIKAVKPSPEIYRAATELAGVPAEEIFFTDDNAANVAGARQFGWDAETFTSPTDLSIALRQRGVRTNY